MSICCFFSPILFWCTHGSDEKFLVFITSKSMMLAKDVCHKNFRVRVFDFLGISDESFCRSRFFFLKTSIIIQKRNFSPRTCFLFKIQFFKTHFAASLQSFPIEKRIFESYTLTSKLKLFRLNSFN